MSPRYIVIANPRSRGGWVQREWQSLTKTIRDSLGGEVDFLRTTKQGSGIELASELGGTHTVISFGGDGTHNEVANGLMKIPEDERPALGILHAGTGGDFRRLLRRSDDLAAACRVIAEDAPDAIDIGRVHFHKDSGEPLSRFFINMTSLGIGGLVDRYVNQSSLRLGGKADFALATLRANVAYRPAQVRVRADETELGSFQIMNVCVCNGKFAGGGMMFSPGARLADGLLNLVIFEAGPIWKTAPLLPKLYRGDHIGTATVHSLTAKQITVGVLSQTAYMDIDGEAPGVAPATFEVMPSAIRLHGVHKDNL